MQRVGGHLLRVLQGHGHLAFPSIVVIVPGAPVLVFAHMALLPQQPLQQPVLLQLGSSRAMEPVHQPVGVPGTDRKASPTLPRAGVLSGSPRLLPSNSALGGPPELLLSAAVFILPTTMWELPTFWDAIVFRGDRPWLGVLFWTTLSTSALFYLFVLAAALTGPLSRVSRAVRLKLDPESEPVLALTAALVIGVTVAFLLGAGATAIVVRGG